jgi:RNA polymerase sigma factor (sigma-70 family)
MVMNQEPTPPSDPLPTDETAFDSMMLLARYQSGSDAAATELFQRYVERLTALARGRLSRRLSSRFDPEDVVMSAYRSFFRRAAAAELSVAGHGDLWRLLVAMTLNKLHHRIDEHTADKRSVAAEHPSGVESSILSAVPSLDPTPDEAAAFADELEAVFTELSPPERRVLEMRLQGELVDDIALEMEISERTVRRWLDKIREVLSRRFGAQAASPDQLSSALLARESAPSRGARRSTDRTGTAHSVPPTPIGPRRDFPSGLTPLAFSDFKLKRLLGAGVTGKVYLARQKSLDREVAVKFLRKAHQSNRDIVELFLQEAETAAKLQHPGIVKVHGLGHAATGGFFLVMDLLAGPNLAARQGPQLGIPDAVGWLLQAAEAIDHAHRHGVIHCDLKPSNLMLNADGRVVVTDLGFARLMMVRDVPTLIGGTVQFMAPEQLDADCGEIGPWTDVYGLGATLFAMLTGQPPQTGRRLADIVANVVAGNPVRSIRELRSDIPPDLAELCHRCLNKSPDDRPQSANEVAESLRRCCPQPTMMRPVAVSTDRPR